MLPRDGLTDCRADARFLRSDILIFSVTQSRSSGSRPLPLGAVILCALRGNSSMSSPGTRTLTEPIQRRSHARHTERPHHAFFTSH